MTGTRPHRVIGILAAIALTASCGSDENENGPVATEADISDTEPARTDPPGSDPPGSDPPGTPPSDTASPSSCGDDATAVVGQGYFVDVREGATANLRAEASLSSAPVGELEPGSDHVLPVGECLIADGETWWRVSVGGDEVWIAARLLSLNPEAFGDVEEAKSAGEPPSSEELVGESGGTGPVLCTPMEPALVRPLADPAPTEPVNGGEVALIGGYRNELGQSFTITVEAFGADSAARAEEFFSSGVCVERVIDGDALEIGPAAPVDVDASITEAESELERHGLTVDDADRELLTTMLTDAETFITGGASRDDPADPAAPSPARLITIDYVGDDSVTPDEEATGYFLIDPSISYNGYDVYSVRRSNWVSATGYSSRGTLALWIYTTSWNLRSSGAASPGRYTRPLGTWAPSSGAFLLATAYKSSVSYQLWGTWRSESWSK